MTKRDFARLAREYMLPQLSGYQFHDHFIYKRTVDHFLRMLMFESSQDHDYFYLSSAIQPLFVPADSVYANFGRWRGGWELTRENESAVMDQVLAEVREHGSPLLDRVKTARDFVAEFPVLEESVDGEKFVEEASAFALIIAGDHDEAMRALEIVVNGQEELSSNEFQPERFEQVERVYEALRQSPRDAITLLETWRLSTLKEIGLEQDAAALSGGDTR